MSNSQRPLRTRPYVASLQAMCPAATPSHRASTAPSPVRPYSGVVLGQAGLLLHDRASGNLHGSLAGFMSGASNEK